MTISEDYFLRTERLGFRTWRPDDLAIARDLWGNPEVTRLIGGPFDDAWIRRRLETEIANEASHGVQYWPIFRLTDDDPVGCCGLRPRTAAAPGRAAGTSPRDLELGFHVRTVHKGMGYATEAARAAIDYAFRILQVTGLFAGHHPGNDASRRVLVKLGFRYTHDEPYAPTGLNHPSYELRRDGTD